MSIDDQHGVEGGKVLPYMTDAVFIVQSLARNMNILRAAQPTCGRRNRQQRVAGSGRGRADTPRMNRWRSGRAISKRHPRHSRAPLRRTSG